MKIKIENVEYELDVKKAKAAGALKSLKFRAMGEFYKNDQSNELYVLTSPACNTVVLICIRDHNNDEDGCRYTASTLVNDCTKITEDEWVEITGGSPDNFRKVAMWDALSPCENKQ